MTSQFGFPFDQLEETDLGRRTIFQTFLRNQNQQQQANFGIPSFGDLGGGGGFQRGQQDFLSGLFNPIFNRFLGQIGGSLQGGEQPSTFQSFLQNRVNPQREFARTSQRQQGISAGSLIGGRTRFLPF